MRHWLTDGLGKYNTYCDILKYREISGKYDVEVLTEKKKDRFPSFLRISTLEVYYA